ncbi:MAG: RNA 3'-terminal phosphate cyclase (ATP) [Natronomonas sp.]|jgi:RNA 3'-terminal phosphate cyclase (ATP)|uniref:RNA 3'-terminal phosphate cyclase n=1 Tax=Natronomonas sp. TaxID=2184060 RepID=UPI003989345D
MQEIDGAEGGGQIIRTAISLSALSGEPIRIENVRGNRSTPGLRPQHLAAIDAAAELCGASVEGAEQESETLVFEPNEVQATDVSVDVGTAGSVALVLDTVLPLAVALDDPASVTVSGGTDVKWAPPVGYHRHVKLPLLAEAGLEASLSVDERGFYPLGGGETTLSLAPSSLSPLAFEGRGDLRRIEVYSTAEAALEDADVAERQASAAAENADIDVPMGTETNYVEADCTGSVVVLAAVYERSRAGFAALGSAGTPSEEVAAEAAAAFQKFHDGPGAVDSHLADQLMVFQALAGDAVYAPELTSHMETNRTVIEQFGYDISIEERDDGIIIES